MTHILQNMLGETLIVQRKLDSIILHTQHKHELDKFILNFKSYLLSKEFNAFCDRYTSEQSKKFVQELTSSLFEIERTNAQTPKNIDEHFAFIKYMLCVLIRPMISLTTQINTESIDKYEAKFNMTLLDFLEEK